MYHNSKTFGHEFYLFAHLDIFFKQTSPVCKFYSDESEGCLNL